MGDNSSHFVWITLLANNLRMTYHGRDDVTVGGNLLWYPEEGDGKWCAAPGTYVVLGRRLAEAATLSASAAPPARPEPRLRGVASPAGIGDNPR